MLIMLDTGPLVALLNRHDAHHSWCTEQAASLAPPFYTCEAVLAEAHFVLHRAHLGQRHLIELLDSGKIELTSIVSDQLSRVGTLMNTYADVPMSFADACLVCMDEELGGTIFTLDKDFRVYRKNRNVALDLIIP